MFDTIHIELPNQCIEGLRNKSETFDIETGELKYSIGFNDSIKVKGVRDVIIIECSLSKLLKGNNIYSLSFFEVIKALQLIEKRLDVSIMKGIIRRLDCEMTLETLLKPIVYFRYLGNSRYYIRKEIQGTSFYYSNKSRSINIYDKIKERKDKKEEIPFEFKEKNILRFECRYKNTFLKTIAKRNCLEVLKVEDLINPTVYKNLSEMIYNEYESIVKLNKYVISNFGKTVGSKSELMKHLANIGIESLGGVNAVQEMIDASRPFNCDVRKEYFSRRKKNIVDIAASSKMVFIGNIITEIDEKIKEKHYSRLKSTEKLEIL